MKHIRRAQDVGLTFLLRLLVPPYQIFAVARVIEIDIPSHSTPYLRTSSMTEVSENSTICVLIQGGISPGLKPGSAKLSFACARSRQKTI